MNGGNGPTAYFFRNSSLPPPKSENPTGASVSERDSQFITRKMAVELDPLFLKAITLLNSRHPDSGRQLKALVQDYRDKITGGVKEQKREKLERRDSVVERVSPKITEKPAQTSERAMSPVYCLSVSSSSGVQQPESTSTVSALEVVETVEEMSSSSFGDAIREEHLDASMVQSIKELANSSFDGAIMEELSSSALLEPTSKKSKLDMSVKEDSISSVSEEEDEEPEDLLEEGMEDLDGPMCCVCQSHATDSADNCLVECHECHNHYHQRCHKPPMTNKDVHDPRFVLYCSQCSRRMKKEMQAAQKSSSSSTSTSLQEPAIAKPVANPFQVKTSIQPFRRPMSTGNSADPTKTSTSPFMPTSLLQGGNGNNGQSQNAQRGSAFLPQDVRMKSMKRLEQVKKRAKMQQQMRKR